MDKNTFKAARDATATGHYSFFIVVSCFGGQKWKRDFAYRSCIKYYQLIVLYRLMVWQTRESIPKVVSDEKNERIVCIWDIFRFQQPPNTDM